MLGASGLVESMVGVALSVGHRPGGALAESLCGGVEVLDELNRNGQDSVLRVGDQEIPH